MSLFSILRKNKQESASGESTFYSRAEEDSKAVRSRAKRRDGKESREDESLDPVLPEKKRARRRLIGAVALVLAAVIGLPMVLDSEPKPLADDIAIQIPSKDKPAGGAIARVEGTTPSKVAASASLDAKEEVVEAPAAPSHTDKKTETAPTPDPSKVKEDAKLAEDAPKANDKTDEATRAKALLEGKPDPKAAEKKAGKYVIQVAALATKEKIDELQGKLKGAGIKSYTEKIATASGDRTRIRVGPFTSKDEAEKARARIVKLGLNGTLVPA